MSEITYKHTETSHCGYTTLAIECSPRGVEIEDSMGNRVMLEPEQLATLHKVTAKYATMSEVANA